MYKRLEEYYRKNSPYNKIRKKTCFIYIVVIFLLLACNYYEKIFFMFIILILLFFVYKGICEKTLGTKLYFKYDKRAKNGLSLDEIILNKEKSIVNKYLEENNLYDRDSIECILNHYRYNKNVKIISGNFLGILSLIISVALPFITKDGYDFYTFISTISYFLALTVVVYIIYFSFNKFTELKKIFKGEEDVDERLEAILSELYVEYYCKKEKNNFSFFRLIKNIREGLRRKNGKKK